MDPVISNLERGVTVPTLSTLIHLSAALDCTLCDLVDVFDGGALEAAAPTRLSILLNHNLPDEHGIYVMAGLESHNRQPVSARIPREVLQTSLDNVRARLSTAIGVKEYRYEQGAVLADDLVELAKVGADLWSTLTFNLTQLRLDYVQIEKYRDRVRRPATIEVASVFGARLGIPAAFVYDFPLDRTTELRICPDGMAALRSGVRRDAGQRNVRSRDCGARCVGDSARDLTWRLAECRHRQDSQGDDG